MKIFTLMKYLFLFFIIFTSVNVYAQSESSSEQAMSEEDEQISNIFLNLLEISVSYQEPLETFMNNVDGISLGFRAAYYNNFFRKDDLFWAIHYQSFRLEKVSNTFNVVDQFAEYSLNSKAVTNIIFAGYGLRYYFDFYTPKFEPFADLKMGINSVYSYTADTVEGSEDASVNFENFDMSLAYAVGLGLQYNVREGQALHFLANFNSSNNSTYYIAEGEEEEYPWDNFDKKVTQLDYLQFFVGITFGF